ncbi:MAG: class I SAM-dependent methyltransferase [Bacteroidota bacterium]
MKKALRFLKKIWILNFTRRIYYASKVYNKKYWQILKWGITSREDTNFTYNLTPVNLRYLANTISNVTGVDYSIILNYINEVETDTILKETILTAIKNSSLKKIADTEVRYGKRLGWYAFARVIKPKIIIETGIDKGLGSIIMCSALIRNKEEGYPGKYYGTDINPEAGYLLSGKYKEVGEILFGDSIKSLSAFTENIDLFISDSDHSAEYEYQEYLTIKKLMTEKTIILGDNSHITDKLAIFSNETNRNFLFFNEEPLNHWYPGGGMGISFHKKKT